MVGMSDDQGRWANLLPEILRSIREKLSWKDYFCFRLTCRDWNFSAELDHGIYKKIKYPFLLQYSKVTKTDDSSPAPSSWCRAYSPAYNKTYYLRAPNEVSDTCISCARYGWLLFSGVCRIFFYRPSTGDIIHLPYYERNLRGSFNRMSFSAPPTSPDCVVVGQLDIDSAKKTRIVFIKRGQSCWNHDQDVPNMMRLKKHSPKKLVAGNAKKKSVVRVKSNACRLVNLSKYSGCRGNFFWPHYNSSPLFHRGAFYCLAQDGRLGVLNHKAKSKDKIWRVFDTSAADIFRDNPGNESYLVECRGELVAIVVGPMGKLVRILKFYEPARVWRIVHDLENQVILLSPAGCVAMECDEAAGLSRNTIHFPRFRGRNHHHVFYSLSTRRFHCFDEEEEDHTSDNLYDTKLPLVHAWMTPTFPSPSGGGQNWDWSRKLIKRPKNRMIHPHYLVRNLSFTQPPSPSDDEHSIPLQRPKQLEAACLVLRRSGEGEGEAGGLIDLSGKGMIDRMEQLALRMGSKAVYSSGNGHLLVLMDTKVRSCSLLYPSSMAEIPLPTWETDFTCGDVVVHAKSSKLVVMVFGRIDDEEDGKPSNKGKDVAMVWRDGDDKWSMHTRTSEIGVDAMTEKFVVHQGQIYGYLDYYKHLVVVELRMGGEEYVIEKTQVSAPQFFSPGYVCIDGQLVESCGELLHIVECLAGECLGEDDIGATTGVRVYKLDFHAMEWRVLEDLGDRAFLWSELGCYACCASKSGLQRNSIYFLKGSSRDLCVYDHGNHTISITLAGPELDDSWMGGEFIMLHN